MALYAWCLRCVPGLGIVFLSSLIICALVDHRPFWHSGLSSPDYSAIGPSLDTSQRSSTLSVAQTIFALYNVFIHILSLIFPMRLCWSLWQITGQIQDLASQHAVASPIEEEKTRTVGSPSSSLTPIDTGWRLKPGHWSHDGGAPKKANAKGMVLHAILLPNYKEDIDTFRGTLDVLASHAQARTSYDVSILITAPLPLNLTLSPPVLCNY